MSIDNKRGYWDPKRFPVIAAFSKLTDGEQQLVVQQERENGIDVAMVTFRLLSGYTPPQRVAQRVAPAIAPIRDLRW